MGPDILEDLTHKNGSGQPLKKEGQLGSRCI